MMMMKLLITLACIVMQVTSATEENIEIDWSKVKPLESYPEFWEGKPLQPHSMLFEKEEIERRIISGITPGRHDFPYKVALIPQMPFGDALCGASLISRWSVLTSGHCVYNSASTVVILGATDLNNPNEPLQARFRVQSSNYIFHHFFQEGVFNSDLAIVRFDFAIHVFTQAVRAVKLPDASLASELFNNVEVTIMGFGKDSDAAPRYTNRLRYYRVFTMSNLACGLLLRDLIDTSHICTSGIPAAGICHGDAGSPLIYEIDGEPVQIGVASFVAPQGCQAGFPSVFTRLTSFLSWIEQNAE